MSKNKNKKNSGLNPRTKENLKLGAMTLINNSACVELARTRPWYGPIIAGLVAAVLTVVPTLTSAMRTNGGDILNTPTYGLETGLVHFEQDIHSSAYDVKFDVVDGLLKTSNWDSFVKEAGNGSDAEPWYHHFSSVDNKIDFAVFVYTGKTSYSETFSEYVTNIHKGINPVNGNAMYVTKGVAPSEAQDYHSSALIFSENSFRVFKANGKGAFVAASVVTNWEYKGTLPINELAKEAPSASEASYAEKLDNFTNSTLTAWKSFLNEAYATQRNIGAWSATGLMFGIYSGFILFMGLMVFIMTRGKNNPYRIITFWQSQKIAYWAAPAPAILAMIFGFMFTGNTLLQFLFIFLYGMRVMWLAMRTLSPTQAAK